MTHLRRETGTTPDPTGTRTFRTPMALAALAVVPIAFLAGCGGDDDVSAFGSGGGDFCALAQEQVDLEAELDGPGFDLTDSDAVRSAFERNLDLLDRALRIAPDELADDFATLEEGFSALDEQLAAVDYDLLALDASALETGAEYDAASDNIDAYVERECGISSEPSSGAEDDIADDSTSDDGLADDSTSDDGLADDSSGDDSSDGKGGPSDDSGSDEASDGSSGQGDSLTAQAFVIAGLPVDQANCLADYVTVDDLISASEGGAPPPSFFEGLDACDVSLQQLAELGGESGSFPDDSDMLDGMLDDLGSGGLPDGAGDAFVSALTDQGFTETEARCLADTLFAEGSTFSDDPLGAFDECGIDISRLAEIGGS